MTLRLVVFDVDGTLVDSQGQIAQAMTTAFAGLGLAPPLREAVRAIIGLSLPMAMARLMPDAGAEDIDRLVEGYKRAYVAQRATGGAEAAAPLYPGAMAALSELAEQDETLLGVATGKSRRGLEHLFDLHDLRRFFVTAQCADDHPSKPHPSMLWQAIADTGVDPGQVVMLGDTGFDMEMACAAGAVPLGVDWGYHAPETLRDHGAVEVLSDFAELPSALETIWGQA